MALRTLDIADGFASASTPSDAVIIAKIKDATGTAFSPSNRLPVDIGTVTLSVSNEVEIKNDSGNPVPVNGTITANIGATNGIALDATLTANGVLSGAVTETAPATDTASSGLNGRLQRIAQRITSLIALFPTALGQGTMSTSMKVVIASDQSSIPVSSGSTTGTITHIQKTIGTTAVRATVAGTAASSTRKRLSIKPSKNNTGAIYYGSSTVSISSGVEIIGPNNLDFLADGSDYYLISDTVGQVCEILEVI